jgi:hypothetical protein
LFLGTLYNPLLQSPCGQPFEKIWEPGCFSQQCFKADVRRKRHSKMLIVLPHGQLEGIDLENVERTFRSNILQILAVTKFALPHLNRGSSTINTSPVTADKGPAGPNRLVDMCKNPRATPDLVHSRLQPNQRRYRVFHTPPVRKTRTAGHSYQCHCSWPPLSLQAGSRPAEETKGIGIDLPLHGNAGQPKQSPHFYSWLEGTQTS